MKPKLVAGWGGGGGFEKPFLDPQTLKVSAPVSHLVFWSHSTMIPRLLAGLLG